MKQRIIALFCVLGGAVLLWVGLLAPEGASGSPRAAATVAPSGSTAPSSTSRPPSTSTTPVTTPATTPAPSSSSRNSNSAGASSSSRTPDGPSAIPSVIANTGPHGQVGVTVAIGVGLCLLGGAFLFLARRRPRLH